MFVHKRQFILGAVAVLVLGSGVYLCFRRPTAFVYQGRTSREWALQTLSADPAGREEASAALKAMGSRVVADLVLLLRTKDSFFRKPIWALAEWMPGRQRHLVLAKTGRSETSVTRRGAARALGVLGPVAEPSVPALAGLLRSPEYELRWEASGALGNIGKGAVPELVKALGETNFEIKEAAIAGLGNIGPEAEASILALQQALDDPHQVVRTMAAYSLSAIGIAALPTLVDAAENGSAVARAAARQGLEKSEPVLRASVPALVSLAGDENPARRWCALKVLGRVRAGDDEAVTTMIRALDDPVPTVRAAAIEALGRAPRRAAPAVPGLTRCLSDDSGEIRQVAAEVLGKIGAPAKTAKAELSILLNDPLEPVRAAAKQTLERLSPPEPLSQK